MSLPGSSSPDASGAVRFHILLLIAAQLTLGMVRLNAVPRVYNDDAWEAALGYSLAFEGALRHSIIEGWGGMHVHFVQNQVVQPLVLSALYGIAGFSLWISRFASVLVGALVLICAYGIARRWLGSRGALLVGLATLAHPWFFEISRRVRPDIYGAALALLACWLWTYPTIRRSGWLGFLAGMAAAGAALSHPSGGVLTAALLAAVLIWDRPPHCGLRLLTAGLGLLLAVSPYIAYVAWACQDARVSFWDQMRGGKPLVGTDVAGMLSGELQRWKQFFQWPKGAPLAIAMLLPWVAGWYHSPRQVKVLCAAIALFALALPFTTVNYTCRYLVGLVPLFAALLVWFTARLAATGSLGRYAARGGWAVYFVVCLAGIGLMFQRLWSADVERVFDRVASVTGTEAKVYGEIMFWLAGERFDYGPFPIDASWKIHTEDVAAHGFDYAIRTAWPFTASEGLSPPPQAMPDWRPGYAIDAICRTVGEKVSAFRDPYFGPIEIYRLHWPGVSDP